MIKHLMNNLYLLLEVKSLWDLLEIFLDTKNC
jgi:hypothetical protein